MDENKQAQPQQSGDVKKRRRHRGGKGRGKTAKPTANTATQQNEQAVPVNKQAGQTTAKNTQQNHKSAGQNTHKNAKKAPVQNAGAKQTYNHHKSNDTQVQNAKMQNTKPAQKGNTLSNNDDIGPVLITRRPPPQKFGSFAEYLTAHTGFAKMDLEEVEG